MDAAEAAVGHQHDDVSFALFANDGRDDLVVLGHMASVAAIRTQVRDQPVGIQPLCLWKRRSKHGGYDDFPAEAWSSRVPNIDVRHGGTMTANRWRKDQFRNQKYTAGWTEADSVPGWGTLRDVL